MGKTNWLSEADTGSSGTPGQGYAEYFAGIKRAGNGQYELHVHHIWGSNQGYLEEHGRTERRYRSGHLDDLLRIGISEVRSDAELTKCQSQLCEAIRQAIFALQDATTEPVLDYFTCRGSVRGRCGQKHLTYGDASRCCASQGGYSDYAVVAVDSDGSSRLPTDEERGE